MKFHISREKLTQELAKSIQLENVRLKELLDTAHTEKKSIFQLLVEKNLVAEENLFEFLSEHLDIPLLNLPALRVTQDLLKLIPKKIVERYQVLPISRIGNLLSLAVSDPFNLLAYDDIRELTKCEVALVLVPPKMINAALEGYYGGNVKLEELLEGMEDGNLEIVADKTEEEGGEKGEALAHGAENAPVVRMVDLILTQAIKSRASDIHFEPYEKEFRVRLRVDGALKETFRQSMDFYPHLVARMKIMSVLDITERRVPQDGRFRVMLGGREIDFRVSVLPIYHGEKIVLRILDRSTMKAGLDQLGFSDKPTAAFAEAVKRPYGMILVTGPTGSGKSTTLYTILNTMNTIDRNIMTIEDPVEYQVQGITQTQVKQEVGLNFATGLRCLLRQSPDIILVGEIRDGETADIAVKAALTGHLVFSTLHTNSASGGFTRLVDMGVEPFLIASSVICVAAQRLMRKICPYCKEPYKVPEEVLRRCNFKPSDLEGVQSFRGKGCNKCNNTGYFGRIATIEVLTVDSDIRELILQKKSSDDIQRMAVERKMETLFENAFGIFKRGVTTLEEVLRVSTQE